MNNKKIICGITGANGNLGTFLIKSNKFRYIKFTGDIKNKKHINLWLEKNYFDIIIHLAAIVPTEKVNKNYKLAKKTNIDGTKNLINGILKFKPKLDWFFFASTSHVYPFSKKKLHENIKPNPVSLYGKTKLYAEKAVYSLRKKNIKFTIGRIFSYTSNLQKESFFLPSVKKKLSLKKKIIFKNLNQNRDFIKIHSIVDIIEFLSKKKFNGIINIGSGVKINLMDIVKKLNKNNCNIVFNNNNEKKSLVATIRKLRKLGYSKKNLSEFK